MKEFLEKIEIEVRAGKFDQVEKQLLKLGKVERKHAVAVANIARRINRLSIAVKILNPIVRPEDKFQDPPTNHEKIEYADVLRQLGAVDEAWELLVEVDNAETPQVLFHQALCLFNQWKYAETLPLLKQYVQVSSLTAYERIVGQVNLAAALIQQEHFDEATTLLNDLQVATRNSGALLMYGSSLELAAQIAIFKGDLDVALQLLEESSQTLKQTGRVVSLYVEKWEAIAASLKVNRPTEKLKLVMAKAETMKHWETVRDCELYRSYLYQDQESFLKLYFGTPYESFRRRICHFAGSQFQLPTHYLHSKASQPEYILDLASGKVEGPRAAQIPLGHAMHKLLILLSQDLYKPLPLMSLFGRLFPGEYMNATTSANRVHQIVKRLRKWLVESKLPLAVEEVDGSYRLELGTNIGLLIPKEPLALDSQVLLWNLLKKAVGDKVFTMQESAEILVCSPSNVRLLLSWAMKAGYCERFGRSSQTAYKCIPLTKSEAA